MKGIVFSEFIDMVEQEFGYEVVDQIIEASELPSDGVYTAIGTYDHSEIVQLLTNLAKATDTPPELLLKKFGRYLFDTFLERYPVFFDQCSNGFQFLESIDNHIHVEVNKLYPEATLPRFNSTVGDKQMQLEYISVRKMSPLAEGLIEKTMEYYKHDFSLTKETKNEEGTIVLFTISIDSE